MTNHSAISELGVLTADRGILSSPGAVRSPRPSFDTVGVGVGSGIGVGMGVGSGVGVGDGVGDGVGVGVGSGVGVGVGFTPPPPPPHALRRSPDKITVTMVIGILRFGISHLIFRSVAPRWRRFPTRRPVYRRNRRKKRASLIASAILHSSDRTAMARREGNKPLSGRVEMDNAGPAARDPAPGRACRRR